jgi:hypothetical protein
MSPTPFVPTRRALALGLALVFAGVAAATTVASLGRYCLTTDGADTRPLGAGRERPAPGSGTPTASGPSCPVPTPGETAMPLPPAADLPTPSALPEPPTPARTAVAAFAVG